MFVCSLADGVMVTAKRRGEGTWGDVKESEFLFLFFLFFELNESLMRMDGSGTAFSQYR